MRTLLIGGGMLDEEFAAAFCREYKPERIVGIDGGLNFCYRNQIMPQFGLGDFDSIEPEIKKYFEAQPDVVIREYEPEKDATDMEIAVRLAVELGSREIYILGATGGRLDHFWGNVQTLRIPFAKKIPCYIIDSQNCISLLHPETVVEKNSQFGTYVSFFPLGDYVEGLTLEGFLYPLKDHLLTNGDSLGVSNEIAENTATIKFRHGILIMIMSKDKE